MEVKLNTKTNEKMLENFPDDPYSDLLIITKTRKLNLVLTYLSIDSNFFADIDPDVREINLSNLHEESLLRVLRSLYGQQLIANSISELKQLYEVVKFLKIDDYKGNIEDDVMSKPQILELIQFLQFSFENEILINQVIHLHTFNKLKLLENNRNYLQLNKISKKSFTILLKAYIQKLKNDYESIENLVKQAEAQIINHVMQNFFNRNNIKSVQFFKEDDVADMEVIWNKFHHRVTYQQPNARLSMRNSQLLDLNRTQNRLKKKSEELQKISQVQLKRKRIFDLQEEIRQKDSIIEQLDLEINKLKPKSKKLDIVVKNSSNIPLVIQSQNPLKEDQISISFLENMKKNKKSKEYETQEDFTVSSVFQPAFDNDRRIPQTKDIKTMKKAGRGKLWS